MSDFKVLIFNFHDYNCYCKSKKLYFYRYKIDEQLIKYAEIKKKQSK